MSCLAHSATHLYHKIPTSGTLLPFSPRYLPGAADDGPHTVHQLRQHALIGGQLHCTTRSSAQTEASKCDCPTESAAQELPNAGSNGLKSGEVAAWGYIIQKGQLINMMPSACRAMKLQGVCVILIIDSSLAYPSLPTTWPW